MNQIGQLLNDAFIGGVFIGAVLLGFLIGVVIGWKLRGEPVINPTDPRTRPSDYPVSNAGFGPDYPFNERPFPERSNKSLASSSQFARAHADAQKAVLPPFRP